MRMHRAPEKQTHASCAFRLMRTSWHLVCSIPGMTEHSTTLGIEPHDADHAHPLIERRNVADTERIASVVAGAGLIAFAATRKPVAALAAAAAGAGLIARGVTGSCAVYRAAHIDTRDEDTRRVLAGERGIHVTQAVLINRPLHEVYAYWRDLRNLPRFMSHLEEVTPLNGVHSHWVAKGPVGTRVEWDAELINEVEDKLIAWRSLPGSDVVSAGSVNFRERRGWGTEVTVKLQYEPPAGRAGAWVAWLFGAEPSQAIREDLRRLKACLEAGELATVAGQPRGGAVTSDPTLLPRVAHSSTEQRSA
jgi:uncharacterized membrane protein